MLALRRGARFRSQYLFSVSLAQDVKARVDIVDLIGESVPLIKSGRTFKARCPFHAEKTPSFVVDPQRQSWRCFGACSEGGDVFGWLQKRENIEFKDALRLLAQRAGIRLEPASPERAAREHLQQRLLDANSAALNWWRSLLADSPSAEHARAYVIERGIEEASAAQFELGYADGADGDLQRHLATLGFRSEELEQAGLIVITEHGPRDRFRNRLMFPIRNRAGACVGFSGRALDDDPAKYVNTPESPVFQKRGLLYGLNFAADAIRQAGSVVVVEGYTDVISAHAHGSPNTVASMGTALTEAQVALIAPLAKDVRFALDSDAAGQAATRRGIETVQHAFADGILRGQDRLSADIRIIELPPGRDPDDLIREQPDAWNALIAGARPFLDFLLDQARARHDLDQPRGRADFADELAPVIQRISDPVIRSAYVNRVAALAQVDPKLIASRPAPRGSERDAHRRAPAESPRRPQPRDPVQTAFAALVVAHDAVARQLDDAALDLIDDAEDRQIVAAHIAAQTPSDWTEQLSPAQQEQAAALRRYAADTLPPFTDAEAVDAALDAAQRIRERRSRDHLRILSMQVAEFDQALPHGPVAKAAAALARGDDDSLDPDILPAADMVLQVRDRAAALHNDDNREPRQQHAPVPSLE